jgi:alkanesulfonate monooxygenase SsuD/methylene tetrahydromethanopterin reductase-like flavin-dependent oxidoreductase (luciferase family)
VVLCVPALVSEDSVLIQQAAERYVAMYRRFQYYEEMFSAAGYPPTDGQLPPGLVDELVVSGTVDQVADQLSELATWAEVMVFPLTGGLADRKGLELCLEAINRAGGE